jgi:pyruvate formate lyase activating enzyme
LRFVGFPHRCLLRCQYCHNPDTWHKKNGHPVTVFARDAADRQVRARAQDQQGGHHARGGEPMLQRPFTMRIFRRCKALGLHTCMDTSGRLGDKFSDDGAAGHRPQPPRHQVGRS